MSKWSCEVRNGSLSQLSSSLKRALEDHNAYANNAALFITAEAGHQINEPTDSETAICTMNQRHPESIAAFAKCAAWFFDRLDSEVTHNADQCDYLKFSVINLAPTIARDESSGRSTNNAPEIPAPAEQPMERILGHFTTSLRMFFSHLNANLDQTAWDADTFGCDWISLMYTRA